MVVQGELISFLEKIMSWVMSYYYKIHRGRHPWVLRYERWYVNSFILLANVAITQATSTLLYFLHS